MTKPRNENSSQHRLGLIISALAVGVLYQFIPHGKQVLYPFTLLFTWVHEMGHGTTALLWGGQFDQLKIFWDASGYALTSAPSSLGQAFTAMGGLLAPPFVGMLILTLTRSWSRFVLWALSGFMLISLFIWIRSLAGFVSVGLLAAVILIISFYGKESVRKLCAQFLGLTLVLFTIVRIDYLFVPSGMVGGSQLPSDISHVAEVLGGPYQMWGTFLAGISFLFLLFGLYVTWRTPVHHRQK